VKFFGFILCRSLLPVLAFVCAVTSPFVFSASSVTELYYAGFALAGNASDAAESFPLTSKLMTETTAEGIPLIEDQLRKKVSGSGRLDNIVFDLVTQQQGQGAVAVAFVVDWENIAYETINNSKKIVADLHGQILVFDFDSKKVLAAFPVAVQLIDVVDGEVTEAYEAELIRRLTFGDNGQGLLSAFAKRFSTLDIKRTYGNYIGVVDVVLESKAQEFLEAHGKDAGQYEIKVADQFGKRLSSNLNIPYVPYTKGMAIGAKMVARFASGSEYQFELPKPDYQIYLTLRGFKKVQLDSNSVLSAWAYGSYMNVRITDFDSTTHYLDIPVKYGAVKKVPNTANKIDDWTIFQESLFSLIDQTTQQFIEPDRKWLAEWSSGKDAYKQLQSMQRIIDRTQ